MSGTTESTTTSERVEHERKQSAVESITETFAATFSIGGGQTIKREVEHSSTNKAMFISGFGDVSVFTLKEVPTPTVGPNDVIVKVDYTSVNPIDWKVRKGFMQVLEKPTFPHVLGKDFAGKIVAKGERVTKFFLKDRVFGLVQQSGAYSQYIKVNIERDVIERKPFSLTQEEAAGAPLASLAAWHSLVELGNLPVGPRADDSKTPTPKVLIIGASGGVGTFAVQFAKKANYAHVTAVTSSKNVDLVKKLGADRVIDYTQVKFTDELKDEHDFDLVVDTIGDEGNYEQTGKLLKKDGVYAAVATEINEQKLTVGDLAKFGVTLVGRKVFGARSYKPLYDVEKKDFPKLIPYLERHEVKTIIGHRFSLDEIAQAHQLSESLHPVGKIIVKV